MDIDYTDALVVVGMQNDYFHGGALPVEGADRLIPGINRLIHAFDHVLFARDWHPQDHDDFAEAPEYRAGSWPEHCVQHSPGAEFHGSLHVPMDAFLLGIDTEPWSVEEYDRMTALRDELARRKIRRAVVCGVPLEIGVHTVVTMLLHARVETILVGDLCLGRDADAGSAVVAELKAAGAVSRSMNEILP